MKPIAIISFLTLTACSTQGMYENVQHNKLLECDKEPTMDARAACKKANSISYKEYEQERNKP